MPENAVYVGRPTRWGNWYVVGTFDDNPFGKRHGACKALVVRAVDKHGFRTGSDFAGFADKREATVFAVDLYRRALEASYLDIDGPLNRDFYLRGLKGKDLACWCPLDAPCHADVLLEIANA